MTLQELTHELAQLQEQAEQAKNKIQEIEGQIISLLLNKNVGQFCVTTKFEFEVNAADLMSQTMSLPSHIQPAYLAPTVDHDKLAKIMIDMPEIYKIIQERINVRYGTRITIDFLQPPEAQK
jgi:hypothetical protein